MFNPSHSHAFELTQSNELLYWLKKQNIVGFKAFQPLIMSALLIDDKTDLKIELIKNTEAYVFLIFNVSARRSNTGTYHFNAKANELYKGDLSINDIIEDLKFWIYGTDDVSGYFDRDNFYNFLKDLFQRDATNGYADWNYLKYLIFEYEYYLNNFDINSDNLLSYNGLNIQSIMPFDPIKVCWKNQITQYTKRERKYLTGSLGNFILAKHKYIDSNNICFDEMKNILKEGLLNEKEVSTYDNWNYDAILERGLNIISFIEKRWNISLGNETHKKELLFLNFRETISPIKFKNIT